jgi:transcriptional regulator with XRE-family HTH domain
MEFIPERLVTLRTMNRLSMRELGEKVGVSHTAISNYEKGEDRPRPSVLVKLGEVFEVSTEYFFKPLTMEVSSISYRKTSDLTKKEQNAVEARVKERIEKYTFIEKVTDSAKKPQLPPLIDHAAS